MQQFFTQILTQPWALPVAIGIGAFVLGLLIPKKGGASWFSAILFFPVNLLLDVLDMVHTRKFRYYGLVLALLCMEAFFAFRASTVYYDVLSPRMSSVEVSVVSVIVFMAIFLCGYMIASNGIKNAQGKVGKVNLSIAAVVILHDFSGTVWMNYGPDTTGSGSWQLLVMTCGMCLLSILPFVMGSWAEQLRPELEAEQEEEVNTFTSLATRKIKRRAVDRVLRLANHTNVVHLVRALPADEFQDFKRFVMPIIAPGASYNLPEMEQVTSILPEHTQSSDSQESGQVGSQETGNVGKEIRQNDGQQSDNQVGTKSAKRQSPTGQTGGQNGNQQPASKTARRDEKIRQHAAKYPGLTHAKLAARFKVSERTIARALNQQNAAPQTPDPTTSESEAVKSTSSPNGYHSEGEHDTDKLVQVNIDERELVELAHQN